MQMYVMAYKLPNYIC